MNDLELSTEAELIPHRHLHALREERGEDKALPLHGLAPAGLGGQPAGVVGLRKRDGWGDAPEPRMLLQAPRLDEIPPLGAVVEVVEPGLRQRLDLLEPAAER